MFHVFYFLDMWCDPSAIILFIPPHEKLESNFVGPLVKHEQFDNRHDAEIAAREWADRFLDYRDETLYVPHLKEWV